MEMSPSSTRQWEKKQQLGLEMVCDERCRRQKINCLPLFVHGLEITSEKKKTGKSMTHCAGLNLFSAKSVTVCVPH